jgi:uncharacterized SAM-binding protein YcdF (DUF218 family)
MGYRTQNNYDDAERRAWRQLRWHRRYDWRLVAIILIIASAFAAGLLVRPTAPAHDEEADKSKVEAVPKSHGFTRAVRYPWYWLWPSFANKEVLARTDC